jgi:hypothetical protein
MIARKGIFCSVDDRCREENTGEKGLELATQLGQLVRPEGPHGPRDSLKVLGEC